MEYRDVDNWLMKFIADRHKYSGVFLLKKRLGGVTIMAELKEDTEQENNKNAE